MNMTDKKKRKSLRGVLFGATGLGVLLALSSGLPLGEAWEAVEGVGFGIVLVLAVAPLWFVANAMSLSSLLPTRVGLSKLVYSQWVGDALSALLPLAGAGGEPFKLGYLSKFASVPQVSLALIYDRLLHVLSGLIYLAGLLLLSVLFVDLPVAVSVPMALVAVGLLMVSVVLGGLIFSAAPARLTRWALGRFKSLRAIQDQPAPERGQLMGALGFKLLGRVAHLPELWLIAVLMGLTGDVGQVALIGAMLTGSTFIFFVVPQGLGVNEAGIAGAFTMMGMAPAMGVAFGLVRRARVLFWSLSGLAVWVLAPTVVRAARAALRLGRRSVRAEV